MPTYLTVDGSGGQFLLSDCKAEPCGRQTAKELTRMLQRRAGADELSLAAQARAVTDSQSGDDRLRETIEQAIAGEFRKRDRTRPHQRKVHDVTRAEAAHFQRVSERVGHATNLFELGKLLETDDVILYQENQRKAGADFEQQALAARKRLQDFHKPREREEQTQELIAVPPASEDYGEHCRNLGRVIAARTTPRPRQTQG